MNLRALSWLLSPLALGACTGLIEVADGTATTSTTAAGGATTLPTAGAGGATTFPTTGSGGATSIPTTGSGGATTTTGTGGSGACGVCAAGEVCNPVAGQCEPVCDLPGVLQPGAPWPMFGGCPTRRGLSPYVGAQTGNVKWTVKLGPGAGSMLGPNIIIGADGTVYVATLTQLEAIRPGGTLGPSLGQTHGTRPAAMAADGSLLVTDMDGAARALDPATGAEKWSVSVQSLDPNVMPAIAPDGTIVVSANCHAIAVTSSGALGWTTGMVNSAKAPAIAPDGRIYFASYSELVALSPSGTILWTYPLEPFSDVMPRVGPDGTIYVAHGSHLYAIRPDGSLVFDVTLGDQQSLAGVSIGPDGTLYVVGGWPSAIYAVSPIDGAVRWQFETPNGGYVSPVIDAAGTIYVPLGRSVYALRPDGTQRWVYTHQSSVCWSVAIGSDGTVYALCEEELIALGP